MNLPGIKDEAYLFKIINDIAKGLRILHEKKVAHRDLKLENIIRGEDQNWKICDFGSCSSWIHQDNISQKDLVMVFDEIEKVTTPLYRAPE